MNIENLTSALIERKHRVSLKSALIGGVSGLALAAALSAADIKSARAADQEISGTVANPNTVAVTATNDDIKTYITDSRNT